jgi:uridylate kinase
VLLDELAVMDAAAVSLCRENEIPVVVFDVTVPGNIQRLVKGETIGTLID